MFASSVQGSAFSIRILSSLNILDGNYPCKCFEGEIQDLVLDHQLQKNLIGLFPGKLYTALLNRQIVFF